jgi:hypothetical protein
MTAIVSACPPIADTAAVAWDAAVLASGYAAAGFWAGASVYQGFTNTIQIPWAAGSAPGGVLVGYHAGRTKHGHSIPVSLARGLLYAPVGAWLAYGFAPAVMPVAFAGLIIYLKGDMTIRWDKDGTLKEFSTQGVAE